MRQCEHLRPEGGRANLHDPEVMQVPCERSTYSSACPAAARHVFKALLPSPVTVCLHRPGAAEWACPGNKERYKDELGGVFSIL